LLVAASTAHSEAKAVLTIGRPAAVSGAPANTRKPAVTIARLVHDQGTALAIGNAITIAYLQSGVCGIIGPMQIVPLSVSYNVPLKEESVLKVVMAATEWPAKPETNIFIIGTNTINGSGIKEVSAESSI
jgi:hypothetical protein